MAKRPNPFNGNPFQSKTRVSEREVNLGVDREEKMKKVYEKTLRLMFEGASQLAVMENFSKKVENQAGPSRSQEPAPTNDPAASNSGNGHVHDKEMKECCKVFPRNKCSFCENIVCDFCENICWECGDLFCDLCAIKLYEPDGEYAVCLSCNER